jgi:hypothetical protein
MRSSPLIAALLIAPVTGTFAQELPLQPGQRVRLTAASLGMERQPAVFQSLRGDTLVAVTDSTVSCPLASVTRLEAYQGRRGHTWLGAGIGFAFGAVVGGVTGGNACKTLGCDDMSWAAVVGGGIGGLAGALLGGGIGALSRTDRWEEIALERVTVSIVTRHDGFGLRASIAF